MTTRRRRFLRLCGIVVFGTLAGCADSSEDDGTPTFTETTDRGPQQTTRTADDRTSTTTETHADGTHQSTQPADDEIPTSTATSDGETQPVKLTGDDGDSGDFFGSSVAMSSDGSTAFVGALRDEDPNGQKAGSAYVFTM